MHLTRREFGMVAASPLAAGGVAEPKRLARKDSFFGIHFDLHPSDKDKALGRDVSEAMVKRFLDRVRPDYVQYDYKGHVGFIGYPSKVSTSAPIVRDSLRIWRDVTARHGVALYIHFSGVYDRLAVKQHPEWARVRPDGGRDDKQTSTFGPYVDKRMIPQLEEAVRNYSIDGAWVDGECWATTPDYCEAAARAFRKATGISKLPKGPDDEGWQAFLDLNREQFRRYVKHYVDALHAFRPGFQIASNWAFSTLMPERPTLPMDFISGDYLGNAAISRARLEARYLAWTGKPWDLMAWGFQSGRSNPVGPIHKSSVQLKQEASVVLAQGGGFQIYYQPTRAGKVDDRHVDVMAKVAKFCRARQRLCHKSETVPEIGVLFSGYSLYHTVPKLFGGWGKAVEPVRGIVDALVEHHFCVDVIPDWRLGELAGRYKAIVVPDWTDIGAGSRDLLLGFVKEGGSLLLVGAENARLFGDVLGVRFPRAARDERAYIAGVEVFADVRGIWQEVEPAGARVIETRYSTYDSSRDGKPAATLADYGKGRIAAVYGPLGKIFSETHAPETRHVIGRLLRRIHDPSVSVDGPPSLEIVRRRKEDHEMLHLLNISGMQVASDYGAIDYVPPIGEIKIGIRMPKPPKRVSLEPGGQVLNGEWDDGVWRTTVSGVALHSIIVWSL